MRAMILTPSNATLMESLIVVWTLQRIVELILRERFSKWVDEELAVAMNRRVAPVTSRRCI